MPGRGGVIGNLTGNGFFVVDCDVTTRFNAGSNAQGGIVGEARLAGEEIDLDQLTVLLPTLQDARSGV